jgi:Protein of unknown function (DUF3567)
MQMLYNSDQFIVVQFDLTAEADTGLQGLPGPQVARGGYEIVDKAARKEIYIEGLLAESFKNGVQAIVDGDASPEAFDEFIGRYTALAQQPLIAH